MGMNIVGFLVGLPMPSHSQCGNASIFAKDLGAPCYGALGAKSFGVWVETLSLNVLSRKSGRVGSKVESRRLFSVDKGLIVCCFEVGSPSALSLCK